MAYADELKPMPPEEEIRRSGEAEQILNTPVVKEALEAIETNVLAWWEGSDVKAQDFREKCWSIYCASRKFRQMLQTHIETGKLARAQIEEDRKRKVFGLFRT